ncbi:glycoside hydrolase family 19 protein [Sphingobium fuliginis]|jgi:putative chitinase|uniref:Glycoside hydrolase family 19 protein n=1 Tax=Sphingobium fuliginis (strain ATCC 27551) TaxID=336203 RepID=A0A7M2GGS8_SPHSA|nr:glycoside hydrolase family 19 protein [Sphingobium fuliginis]QOT71924.1 glycoside hydrolase family 19 protein [Sphingobium fuliginis]
MTDWKPLQRNLGVTADGIVGRGTLRALFQRLGADTGRAVELGISANVHFRSYGILDNGLRLAHFLAQVAHESGGFRYMEEIWGPTEAQKRYEGRKDLGNIVKGDGSLFRGRGPIQITGRANYEEYGNAIGLWLTDKPTLAAIPAIGLHIACEYWKRKGLNAWADADDVLTITKKINGGVNGLADRQSRLAIIKGVIGI